MPIISLHSPPFDRIRCDDPRLRSKCPTLAAFGPSTLAQIALTDDRHAARTLKTATAQLRSWAARTTHAILDDLAEELLDGWERSRPRDEVIRYHLPVKPGEPRIASPQRPRVRQAVAARLGLRGDPPATLAASAQGSGVSTERIRRVTTTVGWSSAMRAPRPRPRSTRSCSGASDTAQLWYDIVFVRGTELERWATTFPGYPHWHTIFPTDVWGLGNPPGHVYFTDDGDRVTGRRPAEGRRE